MRVSYGLFGKTLVWKDIASCEIDNALALRYGGWGIRLGIVQGKKSGSIIPLAALGWTSSPKAANRVDGGFDAPSGGTDAHLV